MKLTFLLITLITAIPEIKAETLPIRELQQNPGIRIQGTIRSLVGNEFILSDGTGEIIVDAGPVWYHDLNLRQGERITVVGEYDDDDFDAYQITRSNGETIRIRSPQGPPPWAGGP
ncbi:MAG: DNA-binding protein [Halothece sp.]